MSNATTDAPKYITPGWTDAHELAARAYVRGWLDGSQGATTDDEKRAVAAELVRQFPGLLKLA